MGPDRCIRTVRKVMAALVKEQTLDDEGLLTLRCKVEATANGWPITKVSDDPRDPEALTPNNLLLLRSGPALPPGLFTKIDSFSRRRWRQVQYLADVFWRALDARVPTRIARKKEVDINYPKLCCRRRSLGSWREPTPLFQEPNRWLGTQC